MSIEPITKTPFLIKLIRCEAGTEEKLVTSLRKKHPSSFFGKVLGKHDIIEILTLNSLHDAIYVNSNPQILNISTFPCFSFKGHHKACRKSLKEAIAPSIVLIRLNEPIFQNFGVEGVFKTTKKLGQLLPRIHSYTLVTMGYYDIVVWLESNNFEDVFDYAEQLRKLSVEDIDLPREESQQKHRIIQDTISIPVISYDNVINPENWSKLQGEISPIVNIRCVPGHEKSIVNNIDKQDNDCRALLGSDDIVCFWKEKIHLKDFTKLIYEFRKKASSDVLIDTVTKLYSINEFEDDAENLGGGTLSFPQPTKILERLDAISQYPDSNQFFIGELINIVSLVNTLIGNFTMGASSYEARFSMMYFLNALVRDYEQAVKDKIKPEIFKYEGWLLFYANALRNSIIQQFSSKGYSESSDANLYPTFAGSLVRIIKAISLIPEFIFQVICGSAPPQLLVDAVDGEDGMLFKESFDQFDFPWVGFICLDLSHGYCLVSQGEVLVVPHKDIFQILNWITLSHEISHAYYYRIDFEKLEESFLSTDLPPIGDLEPTDRSKYIALRKENVTELFAHWFDYKHFFNEDFYFYIWSIWRTYLEIPRVYSNKFDYWIRSLFIWYCHNWKQNKTDIDKLNSLQNNLDREKGYLRILRKGINETAEFIEKKFPSDYRHVRITTDDKMDIAVATSRYIDFRDKFEAYTNHDIVQKINNRQAYPSLRKHVNQFVLKGKIVINDRIQNPFLLLREILYLVFRGEIDEKIEKQVVIALTLSLWEESRFYSRDDEDE